jgi:hypothetical protein
MPRLKKFILYIAAVDKGGVPMNFLTANPDLELLSLTFCSTGQIEEEVLPLLARRFGHLKSLEIVYEDETTKPSESALDCISQVKSIEKLHLQLGKAFGWRRS